ncbi:hypothetical protein D0860_03191 [Hortaea werneckii]|uniref:Uncharacterized protein n=1 Tax=Hortaea werneckii TaxID=91943 RepID=A0A3M7HF39_HORWE|nr:hypothetical protein D0860_03191 [Hortaea werneckii]
MPDERLCPNPPGSDDLTRYALTEGSHTKKRKGFPGGRGNDEEPRNRKSLKQSLSDAVGVKRKRDRCDAAEDEVERIGLRAKMHKGISTIFASSKQYGMMQTHRTGRLEGNGGIIAAGSLDEDEETSLNLAPREGLSGLQAIRPSNGQVVLADSKGEMDISSATTLAGHTNPSASCSTRIFRPPVYRKPSSLSTTTTRERFDQDSPYRYKGDIFAGTAQPRSRKGPVYAGPCSAPTAEPSRSGTGPLNTGHSRFCDFSKCKDRPKAVKTYEEYQKAQKRGLSTANQRFWVHYLCQLGIVLSAPRDSVHSEQDVNAFERAQAEARTKDRFSMGSVSQALATADAQSNGENAFTFSENRYRDFAHSYRASPYSGSFGTPYHETPDYRQALATYAPPRRRVMFSDEVERVKDSASKSIDGDVKTNDKPKSTSRQAGAATGQDSQYSPPGDASISADPISDASMAAKLDLSNPSESDREAKIPSRPQGIDTEASGAREQVPVQKSALRGSAAPFHPAMPLTATQRPASKEAFLDVPAVSSGPSQPNAAAATFTPAHPPICVPPTRDAQQTPGIPAQAQIDAGIWWNQQPPSSSDPSPPRTLHNLSPPALTSTNSPPPHMANTTTPHQPAPNHTPANSTLATPSPKTTPHTLFARCLGSALRWFQHRKAQAQRRSIRRKEKLAQRDHERQTEGLLRIALRPRNDSVNSFTPADPGIFYRRDREGMDHWVRGEG